MQKKITNLYRLILSDKNTRNLFFFLLLNLVFAFVELFYGLLTNSLGLISDSFHMFFDCSALLLGLAASIVTKWRPSDKFTYGFGRAEILAGLANGLFLLFIALFISKEAIERTFEPPEVHHERLFVISVLGFIVNLIGIFVFQHGGQAHHHHGGGSCSHSHTHSHSSSKISSSKQRAHNSHVEYKYDNVHGYSHYSSPTILNDQQAPGGVVALDMNGYTTQSSDTVHNNNPNDLDHHHHHHQHNGDHQHQHHHNNNNNFIDHNHHHNEDEEVLLDGPVKTKSSSGRGQIMQSVLLHIIADTLGSIGVMISAVLMNQFGWMIADPLCSLFIAILISISVYPLLRDSFYILMQRIPVDIEKELPDCLFKIRNLAGVVSVHDTHFWTLNSDTYIGCLKLAVSQGADQRYITSNTRKLLNQIGVDNINVQVDYV